MKRPAKKKVPKIYAVGEKVVLIESGSEGVVKGRTESGQYVLKMKNGSQVTKSADELRPAFPKGEVVHLPPRPKPPLYP
jgi:hypothetical protein